MLGAHGPQPVNMTVSAVTAGDQPDDGGSRGNGPGHAHRRIFDDRQFLDRHGQAVGHVPIEVGRGLAARDVGPAAEQEVAEQMANPEMLQMALDP